MVLNAPTNTRPDEFVTTRRHEKLAKWKLD